MFEDLYIERVSFWIGFLSGGMFFFFLSRLRQSLPAIRQTIKSKVKRARESMTTGVELRFRSDILHLALKQHIASPLFSLEEIIITPRLLAPPVSAALQNEDPQADLYGEVLPYLPDWPELSAAFSAPRFTLAEALQGGANLLLLGNPGSGKTVALAHLAVQAARRSPVLGDLQDHLPVLVHASDLVLPHNLPQDLLVPLIDGAAENASPLTIPRLGKLLRDSMSTGKVLLLLDGLDELPPDELDRTAAYLSALVKNHPDIRIVCAASPDYFGELPTLGFATVAMSAWDPAQRLEFVHRWSTQWERFINRESPENGSVSPLLLNNWLRDRDVFASPLEYTLKVWAAFAGDALGPSPVDALESYLARMTAGIPNARPVLEKISLENVLEMRSILVEDEPEQDINPAGEQADQETQQNGSGEAAGKEGALRSIQEFIGTSLGVPDLLQTGLLVSRKGGRAALVHPVFSAYLAGRCLAGQDSRQSLFEQPTWTGKTLTLRYLSLFSDLTSYVQALYENCDDPSYRNWLQVWQGLRDLPKQVKWRSMVMRRIAAAVQDESLAASLRARGVAALTSTRDPGAGVLFRSFLQHPEPSVRQLGCLGCGLIREAKSVPDLAACMDDTDTRVIKAAMLALGAVSTAPALEALANGLLHGTEDVRRTAAEVFASLPAEGHPALVEGSTMEDLLVRRAAVYGLGRIREPWAKQLIEKMQVEDQQWVVQAAASQVLEELNKPSPHLPRRMPPPTDLPWLIVFAGKQGVGVPPGKAALDLAWQAVKFGEEQEKLAALEYLSLQGDADKAHIIYPVLFSDHGDLREAAYNTLWSLTGAGAKLPSPVQYGMG